MIFILLIVIFLHAPHAYSTVRKQISSQDQDTNSFSPHSSLSSTPKGASEQSISWNESDKKAKIDRSSKKNEKRVRPEGYFTKDGRIARLARSISIEKPHLDEEGLMIAAKDQYLQQSRQTGKRYREKKKAMGIKLDKRKRKYKPKPKDYASTENIINRKAFTLLKSKDEKFTKFDDARKKAEQIINERRVANLIKQRERYQKKKAHQNSVLKKEQE